MFGAGCVNLNDRFYIHHSEKDFTFKGFLPKLKLIDLLTYLPKQFPVILQCIINSLIHYFR